MNTRELGDIGLLKVATKLTELRIPVSIPITDNLRYDLIADYKKTLKRVQVKNVKSHYGYIDIRVVSTNYEKGKWVNKEYDNIEWLIAYCRSNNKFYLFYLEDIKQYKGVIRLRIAPTLNNQVKKINYAKNYELETRIMGR